MKTTLSFVIGICLLTPVCLYTQPRYAVLITEIMADPSPQVGLPNAEWIELTNVSAATISLQQWRLADASGQSGAFPAYMLAPGARVVICGSSSQSALSAFGPAIAVTGFPSLSNDGETVQLKAPDGRVIHAVAYTDSWYGNALKKDGGWSLEMKDTGHPCAGAENWTASTAAAGGTPAQPNAAAALILQQAGPEFLYSYCPDSLSILLYFSCPVDSAAAATLSRYSADHNLVIRQAIALPPLYSQVLLIPQAAMDTAVIYSLQMQAMKGCNGITGSAAVIQAGRHHSPAPGDVVINEILFNPVSNGYDYVEIYNAGKHILDAAQLFIAGKNAGGSISGSKAAGEFPFSLFPGEYLVVTEDPLQLTGQFIVKNKARVRVINGLPSWPDDVGTVLLLDQQGIVLDEVPYKDDWHFTLIRDPEGIALEKIAPAAEAKDPASWHSAAATAGYGTPGYRNSQQATSNTQTGRITVTPAVFSPDNDGQDDICTINYQFPAAGNMGTVQVFSKSGVLVHVIANNVLLGNSGQWYWNGLDARGQRLPPGPYIILCSWFNLRGQRQQDKMVVVLVRRLH